MKRQSSYERVTNDDDDGDGDERSSVDEESCEAESQMAETPPILRIHSLVQDTEGLISNQQDASKTMETKSKAALAMDVLRRLEEAKVSPFSASHSGSYETKKSVRELVNGVSIDKRVFPFDSSRRLRWCVLVLPLFFGFVFCLTTYVFVVNPAVSINYELDACFII